MTIFKLDMKKFAEKMKAILLPGIEKEINTSSWCMLWAHKECKVKYCVCECHDD